MKLARIGVAGGDERRRSTRRQRERGPVISSHAAFAKDERLVFRVLERRRQHRRDDDVQREIASLAE
jgi:hypothetical protein